MKESYVPEGVPGGGDGLRKEAWAARMEGGEGDSFERSELGPAWRGL